MQFAATILLLLGVSMFVLSLYQAYKGTVDLLSLRNVFFVSFSVFQITSALIAVLGHDWGDYPLTNPGRTVWVYVTLAVVFMVIFQVAYQWGPVVRRWAWRVPGENAAPNTAGLLVLALGVLGLGVLFKIVLVQVPVFGPLSDKMGSGLLALAAGLAMWAWAPRLFNPVVAAYAGGVILAAMLFSMLGNYGRRDLVSVMATCAWAMYHGWWKHFGFSYAIKRFAIVGAAGAVMLGAWTSVRGTKSSAAEIVNALASTRLREGLYDLAHGQFSANISMWLIETRPEAYPYDTLHSIRYGGTMWVPRIVYPGKPDALGKVIPKQAKLRGKPDSFNVGPGVVGHVVNDNPWLALWMYPIILGLAFRFADEAVRSRVYSPFIALPVATGLGELIGLARGELGLFAFNAFIAIVSSYLAMVVIRMVLGWFGWRPTFDAGEPDWFDEHNPLAPDDPTEAYADYGDDSRAA